MANKLRYEESPYLKQHQNNPVNWYPWGAEAFEVAKRENKLIFLSIGYSACHWCHVMEKESFNNKEIADILNRYFISIKVDKEERPDIDRHFQDIFMKANNKPGGWPLSIFMTPQKVPLYSATYIPPIPNYGLMGFRELIDIIAKSYQKDPNKLESKGLEILEALKPKSKIEATKITDSLIEIASQQIKQLYDSQYGGFGNEPKFPHSYTLNLAIDLYKLTKDSKLEEVVCNTLDNILKGGMYDIVEGGFCRYSTTKDWLIPHFEKMTYDNAQMVSLLLKAYRVFKNPLYKQEAFKTIDFMLEKMSKDGLFFSASDADSNEIEGEYFVYSYKEATEILDKDELALLNIYKNGNFDGKNIVRVDSADRLLDSKVKDALNKLKRVRANRDYPAIDQKIISSWNGMMIAALYEASMFDSRYLDIANRALEALESKMIKNITIYHTALLDTNPKIEGFLEDYAWVAKAFLAKYSATLDEVTLIKASNFANEAIKRFYRGGLWLVGGNEFDNFEKDSDASFSSSVAVMVQNLLTLRSVSEPIYEKFAYSTLEVNSYNIMRQPISRPTITNEAIRYIKDDIIIKSSHQNLKELIGFDFKYPYTLLKPTLNSTFELCTNKACFGTYRSLVELKEHI